MFTICLLTFFWYLWVQRFMNPWFQSDSTPFDGLEIGWSLSKPVLPVELKHKLPVGSYFLLWKSFIWLLSQLLLFSVQNIFFFNKRFRIKLVSIQESVDRSKISGPAISGWPVWRSAWQAPRMVWWIWMNVATRLLYRSVYSLMFCLRTQQLTLTMKFIWHANKRMLKHVVFFAKP